jgi:hypothetical protein
VRKVGIALLAGAIGVAACTTAAGAPAAVETAVASNPAASGTMLVETPRPTGRPTPTTIAEPVPDAMLGAWYMSAPAFWSFFRAGDEVCVKLARTDRDCLTYQLGDAVPAIGSASMAGRILNIDWLTGYCAHQRTSFGIGLSGDTLKFFDQPDDCGGDTWTMTRAGTGSAPSAPRPPGS